jgi:hypothetical protein
MSITSDHLIVALREIRDGAKDVRESGEGQNASDLDGLIDHHIGTIGAFKFAQPHLAVLRGEVHGACIVWQNTRRALTSSLMDSPAHQQLKSHAVATAKTLVAQCDSLLAAMS